MNKQYFYDDRRKFQPTVSMYALAHHHQLPPVLLTLLKVVQTPNAWSGF
jgi:predicted alternative tryptophan synthase beta-subunit